MQPVGIHRARTVLRFHRHGLERRTPPEVVCSRVGSGQDSCRTRQWGSAQTASDRRKRALVNSHRGMCPHSSGSPSQSWENAIAMLLEGGPEGRNGTTRVLRKLTHFKAPRYFVTAGSTAAADRESWRVRVLERVPHRIVVGGCCEGTFRRRGEHKRPAGTGTSKTDLDLVTECSDGDDKGPVRCTVQIASTASDRVAGVARQAKKRVRVRCGCQ